MGCLDRLCFITGSDDPENRVLSLLESGIRWIQYREKDKTRRELFQTALNLRRITQRFNACLIVNDYADVALAVDADGVHLGQDDLPLKEAKKIMGDKIIGISTHTIEEAIGAEEGGANYIGFGPVFNTETKNAGKPKGLDLLRKVKASVGIPVIAIGGIKVDNSVSVFQTGCDGIAVSSGLIQGDVRANAKKFLSIFTEMFLK